jgi:hypothetical protein
MQTAQAQGCEDPSSTRQDSVAICAGGLTGERVILQGATCELCGRLDIGCQAVSFLNFLILQ